MPLPVSIPREETGRFLRRGDDVFVEWLARQPVKGSELVMRDDVPFGVAMHDARAGQKVLIQIYGSFAAVCS